jgi:hypothetical protein
LSVLLIFFASVSLVVHPLFLSLLTHSDTAQREEDRFIFAHPLGFVILYDFLEGRAGSAERASPHMV